MLTVLIKAVWTFNRLEYCSCVRVDEVNVVIQQHHSHMTSKDDTQASGLA